MDQLKKKPVVETAHATMSSVEQFRYEGRLYTALFIRHLQALKMNHFMLFIFTSRFISYYFMIDSFLFVVVFDRFHFAYSLLRY